MLSPPWVLGIQGGVRAANMLGNKSTLTVVNSTDHFRRLGGPVHGRRHQSQ